MASPFAEILRLLPLLGAGGQGFVQGRQAGQQYRAGEQAMSLERERALRDQTRFEEGLEEADYERTQRPARERLLRQKSEDLLDPEAVLLGEELGLPPVAGFNRERGLQMLSGARAKRAALEQKDRADAMRRKMYESRAQLQAIIKDVDWRNYLISQVNRRRFEVQMAADEGNVDPNDAAMRLQALDDELEFLTNLAAPARQRLEGAANRQAADMGVQTQERPPLSINVVIPD